MRWTFIASFFLIRALAAQEPPRKSTFVIHPPTTHIDSGVRLLAEKPATAGILVRGQATPNAPICGGSALLSGTNTPFAHQAVRDLTVTIPSELRVAAIESHQIDVTAPWTDAVVHVVSNTANEGTPDSEARVYLESGPQSGFPVVILPPGATVRSFGECHFALPSGQDVRVVRAQALGTARGPRSYVLAYANIEKDLWLSFLAESADQASVPTIMQLLRSVRIHPRQ